MSVYCWLSAHAMFNVTCFLAFFEAADVISSILSIQLISKESWVIKSSLKTNE